MTSRARRSTFGTTTSDRRCDTKGRHPEPEVLQLSLFLSRKRKDILRLTPQEQPTSSQTLRSENPPTHESRFGLSESTNAGKVFCVESVLTQRIIIRTSNFDIRTCNFEHLFQYRRYLISLCHARYHAFPTQNGNYQLLRWIDQHPKHLKGPQR